MLINLFGNQAEHCTLFSSYVKFHFPGRLQPATTPATDGATIGSYGRGSVRLGVLVLLSVALMLLAACGPEGGASVEVNAEDEALRIAAAFAQTGDVNRARIELQDIEVANPPQWLLLLAERYIVEGRDLGDTQALVQLTMGLGLQTRTVTDYARQQNILTAAPEPTFEVAQTSESNVIALQPAPREAEPAPQPATEADAEVAPEQAASDLAPEAVMVETAPDAGEATGDTANAAAPEPVAELPAQPVNPMIQASNALNVRSGPGTDYPVVGALQTGAQADIIARNPQADWWQVSLAGGQQGWVYGPLVTTSGNTGAVVVAVNIPAPPPTPVPAPVAVAPPAQPEPQPQPQPEPQPAPPQEEAPPAEEAPPPSGEAWSVSTRLRPVGQDAQSCGGGQHNIFVTVLDAGGAPMNGVRIREVYTGQVKESGGSGPGMAHWDIYRGGGGQVQLVDEGGNPMSPASEGMSADWPAVHMMWEAGYCNCKPHPDIASCEADLNNKAYLFAVGHYTYEVVFRRNH